MWTGTSGSAQYERASQGEWNSHQDITKKCERFENRSLSADSAVALPIRTDGRDYLKREKGNGFKIALLMFETIWGSFISAGPLSFFHSGSDWNSFQRRSRASQSLKESIYV